MKLRILAVTVLAAFVLSVTFNTYAQTDTKKVTTTTTEKTVQSVDKKVPKTDTKKVTTETTVQTIDKKVPKTENKMDMKKGDKKVKVVKTEMKNDGTKIEKTDLKKNGKTVLTKEVTSNKEKGTKTTTTVKKGIKTTTTVKKDSINKVIK